MKKAFLILSLCFFTLPLHAEEITIESKISAVTVFPDRANISRMAKFSLPAGKNTLIFNELPAGLMTDSIRVSGKGTRAFSIGSVETKQVFSNVYVVAEEKKLQDQLTEMRDQRLVLEAELKAIEAGKIFVEGLSRSPSTPVPLGSGEKQEKLDPDSWKKAWQTIQTGMSTLGKEAINKQIAIRKLDAEINAVQQKLRSMSTGRKSYRQVRVNVESKTPAEAEVTLQYQIYGASWQPLYEARLDSDKKKVVISQYGNISQRTGEDWTGVALTLSTAFPSVNMAPPQLHPRWLDLASPIQQDRVYRSKSMKMEMSRGAGMANFAAAPTYDGAMVNVAGDMPMAEADVAVAVTSATEFSGVFEIKGASNVPADGAEYRFTVGDYTSEAEIRAETTPAQDASAYLISTLTFKGELPLLPGKLALYRDGAFIGNSFLDLLRPNEKLHLSFGQDDKIRVKFTSLGGEKSEGGVIIRDAKKDALSRMEIQNLHNQPIKIAVYDLLPIARNSDISVKILKDKTTPGYISEPNNKVGVIMWESIYNPKEKKTIDFGYSVTYPKDRILQGM